MKLNEVIKYPILTEKTHAQMLNGVYTFAVDPRTNKAEVKKAVEFIFDVKVEKVNIIRKDKQKAKLGRSEGFTNIIKKAIVKLAKGEINIYPDEVSEASNKTSKNEEKVMSEAEKRAAEKIASKAKEKAKEKESKKPEPKKEESKEKEQKNNSENFKKTEEKNKADL